MSTENPKTFTKMLEHKFSLKELEDLKDIVVIKLTETEKLENQKKEFVSGISANIKTLQCDVVKYLHQINDGGDTRDIECDSIIDMKKNKKSIIRLDTNEIIETFPLSAEEKQFELDLKGAAAKLDSGKKKNSDKKKDNTKKDSDKTQKPDTEKKKKKDDNPLSRKQ